MEKPGNVWRSEAVDAWHRLPEPSLVHRAQQRSQGSKGRRDDRHGGLSLSSVRGDRARRRAAVTQLQRQENLRRTGTQARLRAIRSSPGRSTCAARGDACRPRHCPCRRGTRSRPQPGGAGPPASLPAGVLRTCCLPCYAWRGTAGAVPAGRPSSDRMRAAFVRGGS